LINGFLNVAFESVSEKWGGAEEHHNRLQTTNNLPSQGLFTFFFFHFLQAREEKDVIRHGPQCQERLRAHATDEPEATAGSARPASSAAA
jgi:hypothetical protein